MEGVVGIWRAIIYTFFTLLGGVILINLLIAIMGDAYDRSRHNEKAELIRHRAAIAGDVVSSEPHRSLITEGEHRLALPTASTVFTSFLLDSVCFEWRAILRLMSAITHYIRSWFYRGKVRRRVSGKYFHYLVPVEETGGEKNEPWQGKIREIEKSLKREMRKQIQEAAQRTEATAQRTEASVDRCSEFIEMLADRVKQMETNDATMKDQIQTTQETLTLILQKLDQRQT